ncbi:hypothetical protein NQ314_002056, partial [Rhamnusium bicolor]
EMNVAYLFTRYRFNWDEVDFSIFSTYSMVTNLIGTSVSVGIFSHILKIDDAIIGIYSSMSKILSSFVYGFAKTSLVFYLGAIVEILNGTSFIAMRSIASKLVPTEELGKVNSLFGACEALMPLVYGPIWMYVQHKRDAKALKAKNDLETGPKPEDTSIIADVILSAVPKEAQIGSPIGSPILNGYRNRSNENGIKKRN